MYTDYRIAIIRIQMRGRRVVEFHRNLETDPGKISTVCVDDTISFAMFYRKRKR